MADRLYADVEYMGISYCDAEWINGIWYCEDADGGFHRFLSQSAVAPINEPSPKRRHPAERSGCVMYSQQPRV